MNKILLIAALVTAHIEARWIRTELDLLCPLDALPSIFVIDDGSLETIGAEPLEKSGVG